MEENERIRQIAEKHAKEIADTLGRNVVDASTKSLGLDKTVKNDGRLKSSTMERGAEKTRTYCQS